MRRVKNRRIIRLLSLRLLKARKWKNLIAIAAVLLTSAMFTSVLTIGASMIQLSQESTMRQVGGSAMAGLKYVLPEDFETLQKDSSLLDLTYRITAGFVSNPELRDLTAEVCYAQDEDAKLTFSYPAKGHMPQERLEIAVSDLVLEALGIPCELGTPVPLSIQVGGKTFSETFTLSGYWEGDEVAMSQMCWISREYCDEIAPTPQVSYYDSSVKASDSEGYWMVDFNFKSSFDIEGQVVAALERNGFDPEAISYGVNWAYMESSMDLSTILLYSLVLLIILTAGYLIIYNIFYITVSSDIHSYGLLKTIGTTGKQLRGLVYRQAALLSLLGIPLGLAAGFMTGKLLLPFILNILVLSGATPDFSTGLSPLVFVGAVLFTLLTVWISCLRPCRIASKVSATEALRYNGTASKGKKKSKRTRRTTMPAMAWSNLARSRKKTTVVVLSLSLSLMLLNTLYTAVQGMDADKFIQNSIVGDFEVMDLSVHNTTILEGRNTCAITPQIQNSLSSIPGVESISNVYYTPDLLKLDETGYENALKILDAFADDPYITEYDSASILEDQELQVNVYGIDSFGLENVTPTMGTIDPEKFASGGYVILDTYWRAYENYESGIFYRPGDTLTYTFADGTSKTYEVMALGELGYALTTQSYGVLTASMLIPEADYTAHNDDTSMITVLHVQEDSMASVTEALEDFTGSLHTNLKYVSKQTYLDQFDTFLTTFVVVGGVLCFVLAFIGILNFFNSIITMILEQKQEFAMMEAVGMTGKQLMQMLRWEGIFHTLLSVLFSSVIGSLVTYLLVCLAVSEVWFFSYHFTVLPILVCLPILLLITCLIPVFAYRRLCRDSIIERLRIE